MREGSVTSRGLLGRMRQGWDLANVSLRVVRRRKRIVLFPVMGVLALVLILGGLVGGVFLALGMSLTRLLLSLVLLAVLDFGLNLILYFLLVLLNAAVAVFALDLFDGRTPTVFGNLLRTFRGGRPLAAWAGIASAVSTGIHAAQLFVPGLRIELAVVGFVWTFFVPLVAPIVLFEGLGPVRAMRRSTRIRRSTWIEGISGLVSVYVIFVLFALLGAVPPLLGYAVADGIGLGVGALVAVAYLIPLFFAGTTTKSVLVAVVYRYGTTGEIPPEFRGTTPRGRGEEASAERAP